VVQKKIVHPISTFFHDLAKVITQACGSLKKLELIAHDD